jgi:curved DNA-binding protein
MTTEFKDYYQTLGVSRTATQDEIKGAFRKLARKHHPDVARDKKNAEEKFKEINEAYEVLGDPAKRRKYDELGAQWKHGGGFQPPPGWQQRSWQSPEDAENHEFSFGGTGFSDFFEQFFGQGRRGGFGDFDDFSSGRKPFTESAPRKTRRGSDIEGDIMVTLDEAAHGSVRTVSLRRRRPGSREPETYSFRVRIPPGVQDAQVIRVPGKGEEGPGGGAPGDLYLHVRLAAHPDFQPRGADLYHEIEVAPWDAVLGSDLSVPSLEGHLTVRMTPGMNHGQSLRIRGKGLPKGQTGERGDLYVIVDVRMPAALTAEEKRLWEQLRNLAKRR